MTIRTAGLDPLLAPALEMESRPVVESRRLAAEQAGSLTNTLEMLGLQLASETDAASQQQLANICNALGVLIIGVVAYSRGLVPKVASQKPNANIIVQ